MRRRRSIPAPALAMLLGLLVACTGDSPSMVELDPQFAKGGAPGGGGGGQVTWAYTMSGDAESRGTAPTASAKATAPFNNLSLDGMSLALVAPTGDIDACRTGSGSYTDTFGYYADQVLTGSLKIAKTGTLSFLGTSDAGDTVQFSVSDATGGPVQTAAEDGSYTYEYSDARFYYGGNTTVTDGLYRCVNLVLTATPQP
jgi:hypothetical protein